VKKHVNTDDRAQCPICLLDVADLSSRTSLTKHLASHLERFSLDCLPLSASSWGNENLRDDESGSSDPDQGLAPEPHEQTVHNEQDATTENLEAKQPPEKRNLSVEGAEPSKAITHELNLERKMVDTEKEEATPNYRRMFREVEEGLEADELQSTRKLAKSHEETSRSIQAMRRSLAKFAEATTKDTTTGESKLELEKIYTERKQILEEYDRKQHKARDQDGEEELSILEHPTLETINAEYKRMAEDHEREQRKAKDEAGEEELSTLEPSKLEIMGASMRLTMALQERIQKQLEEQADLLRHLERFQNNDMVRGTEQDNMNDAMRKRLEEADFTPSQIDAIMRNGNGRKQEPASKMPKTAAPPPPADAPTGSSRAPVYLKVHTDHMAIETLKYYDIPWEYDQVRKKDSITVVETSTDFDHSPTLPTSSSSANWTNVRLMSSSILQSVSGQTQSCWKIPGAVL
jgi:hypothetical protein